MGDQNSKKRNRSLLEEPEIDLPEVKRLREDLLESFEDGEFCGTSLDSFMKSFEDEISLTELPRPSSVVIDLTESELDLASLLEASNDELGLQPSTELLRVESDSSGITELWEFEDQMRSFHSFEFGVGVTENVNGVSSEYVALDGLFDYTDLGFGPVDLGLQPENLSAQ